MATNKLTDAQCKRAPPKDKPYKLSDGHGMYLYVSTTGAKVWRMGYRLAGREQTHVIGPYPLISLADARTRRDALRLKLLDGKDLRDKPPAPVVTFGRACTEYLAGRKDVTEGYADDVGRALANHLRDLTGVPISAVTRERLLELLLKVDNAGKHEYARRVRIWAGQVFDWAKERGHCTDNPASTINPEKAFARRVVEHHAALSLAEIPAFMARLSMENPRLDSVLACKLLALTWVRTKELRFMKWSEVEGNTWKIPAPTMKMRREHVVPLSTQAMALLDTLRAQSRGTDLVFPSYRDPKKPISENTILYMIWGLGYRGRMTGHGFRTVGSTWANESGYPADHIELQLAHEEKNKVRAAYNRAEHLPARRVMLQAWGDWLTNQPGIF
jgi:integrase